MVQSLAVTWKLWATVALAVLCEVQAAPFSPRPNVIPKVSTTTGSETQAPSSWKLVPRGGDVTTTVAQEGASSSLSVMNMVEEGQLKVDRDDEIVADTLTAYQGDVVHPRIREILGLEPLPSRVSPSTTPPSAETAETSQDAS